MLRWCSPCPDKIVCFSSLEYSTPIDGSSYVARINSSPNFSSSALFFALTAVRNRGCGKPIRLICHSAPGPFSVWFTRVALSFTVHPISPAHSSVTFTRFRPALTNICPIFSLLPVAILVSSIPSVSVPLITRKKATSPKWGSTAVLKTKIDTGPPASACTSPPPMSRKFGALSGPGATLIINSMSRFTPMSRRPERQKTGTKSRLASPSLIPDRISSCVSVPFSK